MSIDKYKLNNRLREFLIATIRSGIVKIKKFNLTLHPPSLTNIIDSYYVYEEAFNNAVNDGLMTVEQIDKWMLLHGLWTNLDDDELDKTNKKIEDLKVQLYKNFNKDDIVRKTRKSLRNTETTYINMLSRKNTYYSKSCESYAESTRLISLINCCCKDKISKLDDKVSEIIHEYNNCIIEENTIRFLARSEPWRSLWSVSSSCGLKLFRNEEPTINQKNLVLWSKTYDSVHESLDCPSKTIIEDDDFLDGWFIEQHRKRIAEQKKNDFESTTKNSKIRSSQEVFLVANNDNEAEHIHSMNSQDAKNVIRERQMQRQKKGNIKYSEFRDQKEKAKVKNTK